MLHRTHQRERQAVLGALMLLLIACGPGASGASGASGAQAVAEPIRTSRESPPGLLFDWCDQFEAAIKAAGTNPGDTVRLGAILHTAIFDAVNGVSRRYRPIHELDRGPRGASLDAAAAQAAHDALASLLPSGTAGYDALLATQLAGLDASGTSIAVGKAWGSKVAADILAWRAADGRSCDPAAAGTSCPNVLGSSELGRWRPVPPTPPGAAAALPQFVHMVPFVLQRPDQFLADYAGPPPLDSVEYAASVNESKALGSVGSARSVEQTQVALFWADNAGLHWNRIAQTVARAHPEDLLTTTRLFAQLNVALADAAITVWTSKYKYNAWRPYHAIREPTPYNPWISPDPSFVSLVATPNHQEYGSGHSTVSAAVAVVLERHFGDHQTFVHTTDTVSPLLTSTSRTITGFSAASREVDDARVFGGIHFRFTVEESHVVGRRVGEYVVRHAMRAQDEGDE
jgi:hypothetical protein